MTPFGCATFLKASLLIPVLVFSYALAIETGCKPSISEKKAGKVLSRGESHIGVSFVNFKEDKFSYLNITILGKSQVDRTPQCSLACLETPTCFSYNLAAKPDINGKLLCELLPSDKYNNSDKFMFNEFFHHFSITSPCSGWPCKNHGTCLPLYEENSYKCICKAGFTGPDCENEIKPCDPSPCLNGGNCTNEADGNFTCHCASSWTGETCQEKTKKGLEESVIIGSNQTYLVQLSEWLKLVSQSNSSWKLCWRGSRDGWASSTFHSLCNGQGPTVTIIKVNLNIFGGYASVSWDNSASWKYDSNAFLFSLANEINTPQRLTQKDPNSGNAIYSSNGYGPTFGNGHDLYVASNASGQTASYTVINTYHNPNGTSSYHTFLAGQRHFDPSEIETFYEAV